MTSDVVTKEKTFYKPTPQQMLLWFPNVDPGIRPFGARVLVQMKLASKVTRGGVIISDDTHDAVRDNMQIGIVKAVGPLAYHKRDTLAEWPEEPWCKPGDLVRVPRFGQHEYMHFPDPVSGEEVQFRLYDDFQMLGAVTSDPDRFRAYI